MLISLDDVGHVATLARLGLSPAERELMRTQLSSILAYVESLRELDTSNVPPSSHVIQIENVSRPDVHEPGLPLAEVMANAPDRQGDYFSVPAVLDDQ
jgi:aspartyl-tRNA(Asn)/glutamyl-tRNA(Gln) amidotransferase subunit C